MFCTKCGNQINEGAAFCTSCGTPTMSPEVAPTMSPEVAPPMSPEVAPPPYGASQPAHYAATEPQPAHYAATEPQPKTRKLSKKTLAIVIPSCVVFIAAVAAAIILFTIQSNRASAYDEAIALMDAEKYSEAQEIFASLGRYEDSEELAIECQQALDYISATIMMDRGNYSGAKSAFEALGSYRDSRELADECQRTMDYDAATQLMESGMYSEASAAFLAIGDFKDSREMADLCQSEADYATAIGLMESEDYAEANEMFAALGVFKDSESLAEECSNWVAYGEALAFMGVGDYGAALALLDPLSAIGFEDSTVQATECSNILTYEEAEQAVEEELFYTAYRLFMSILHYSDSASRAEMCIQEQPSTGQVYRNSEYGGSAVSLKITTPKDDSYATLIKIYTADETLVSTIFIRNGGSHTVRLPANTYMIKSAYGTNWFGDEELFGDEGYYQTLLLGSGNATTYAFSGGYDYTLTLRNAKDGNVGTQNESRSGF